MPDDHIFMLTLKDSPRGSDFMWRCQCGASGKGRQSDSTHREKHKLDSMKVDYYVPQSMLEEQEERTREIQELVGELREKLPPKEWLVLSHKTLRSIFHDLLEATYADDVEQHINPDDPQSVHEATIAHGHMLIGNEFFWEAFGKRVEATVEAERHE